MSGNRKQLTRLRDLVRSLLGDGEPEVCEGPDGQVMFQLVSPDTGSRAWMFDSTGHMPSLEDSAFRFGTDDPVWSFDSVVATFRDTASRSVSVACDRRSGLLVGIESTTSRPTDRLSGEALGAMAVGALLVAR